MHILQNIVLKPLQIQQLEIAGDDSDSGLDSDGNYGRVGGLRRRTFASKNSVRSEMESRNENRNSRPTSVLSRLVGSSTPAFWTYIAGRYKLYRIIFIHKSTVERTDLKLVSLQSHK